MTEKKREARLMRRDLARSYKKEREGLKRRYLTELYSFYDLIGLARPVDPPKRVPLEEVGNAVSHGLGALLSVAALVVMLFRSHDRMARVGAAVYFFGLFAMFLSSCLYHALGYGTKAKRVFRRFDYASVYLLIGATFFPLLLNFVGGNAGAVIIFCQWAVILTAVVLVAVFGPERFYMLHIGFYLVLGWSGLLLLPRMLSAAPGFASYIFGGGILYTLGVIPCAMKGRGAHFVWHLFVLFGAMVQWGGVLNFLYPK